MSFFNAALKTQEKFGLQSRSVPGSCCEFWYQWTFSLHEPWVLAISVPGFKLEFHFCQNSVLVLFTIEVCPWLVLQVLIQMNVMFARAMSFFNAALKTQEKFGLQLRSVPGSCCKLSHQWKFSLHEPWVLAISVPDFKLEFHFCQNSVLVLFTIEVCPCTCW